MKIEYFTNDGVSPDGKCDDGGAVIVGGGVVISEAIGGCGLGNCKCSTGHWVSIIEPRDAESRSVSGVKISFDDGREMDEYVDKLEKSIQKWRNH